MRSGLPARLRFVGLPLLALVTVVAMTLRLHSDLKHAEAEQIARIVALESYAARSRMVRSMDALIAELQDLQAWWTENAALPPAQRAGTDNIDIDSYAGIDYVLWWNAADGSRYLHDPDHPGLGHAPDAAEWAQYEDLLVRAGALGGDAMRGPWHNASGRAYFLIYLLPATPGSGGALVARLDADHLLTGLLADDSPGYAITVDWGEERIFQRNEPAARLRQGWMQSGAIRNQLGVTWEVRHAPTVGLVATLDSSAIDMVRIAGLLIAVLMVVLLVESGRATRIARKATRAERTIKALNLELEAKVRQRTREVAERSQDLLTITDSVGHDLRNPLNAASTNLQLLALQHGEALGEDGRALLAQAETSLAGTTGILDRLLELSSVFSERFSAEVIDLQALVRETFDELVRNDPQPPAELVMGELPKAHGERILVRTLVHNLLANALKYSRGEPLRRVIVNARHTGDEVVYSVSDNGIGFDDAAAERMFRAYERLDAQREGLGLGLDIAARVVLRHRGRIWAIGEPGVGASFYFTLGPAPAADPGSAKDQ